MSAWSSWAIRCFPWAIAEEVYRRYPELPEGELVKLHHVVVSTVALAKVARDLHLGRYILLGKGEIHTGGADKDSILADTMEAIFGLTYLEVRSRGGS